MREAFDRVSYRTTLGSASLPHGTLYLIHATPGVEPAGAGSRVRSAQGWLVQFYPASGGAPVGRWHTNEKTARDDFASRAAR